MLRSCRVIGACAPPLKRDVRLRMTRTANAFAPLVLLISSQALAASNCSDLAATYVVAAYTALIFNRRFPRPEALPGIFVAVCLTAVFLLRVLTPTIGE